MALSVWHDELRESISSGKVENSNRMMVFGMHSPDHPEANCQYKRPSVYFLDATASNGTTSVFHRRNMVTLLYSTWEDRHRALIAKELGLSKDDLKSAVFRDVNVYRRAIAHAGGKLPDEPKVFHFFRKGEEASLTNAHIEFIFRSVVDELNRIGRDCYGTDPEFSFDQPLIPGMTRRPRSIKQGDILEGSPASPAYLTLHIGRSDSS